MMWEGVQFFGASQSALKHPRTQALENAFISKASFVRCGSSSLLQNRLSVKCWVEIKQSGILDGNSLCTFPAQTTIY
jgi:hypothetical protein